MKVKKSTPTVEKSTFRTILKNSYATNQAASIEGYNRDSSLSGKRVQVYYNPKTNQTVIAHRGTQGFQDWITDMRYVFDNNTHTNRFEHSRNIQQQAEAKYKNSKITTVGHSLGGALAEHSASEKSKVVTYNGAVNFQDAIAKPTPEHTHVRTSNDIVSVLRRRGDVKTIESGPSNILYAHSTDRIKDLREESL